MKTYILKRPDCEWCDVLTVTWSSLDDYVKHVNDTYYELLENFANEIVEFRNKYLNSKSTNIGKWFTSCQESTYFVHHVIEPWLKSRNINNKWFFEVDRNWRYNSDTPPTHRPYTTENFGELVISFDSDLPQGVVAIC